MVKENYIIKMVIIMKDNLLIIYLTVMVIKNSLKIILNIVAILKTVKKMEKEKKNGQMVKYIQEILLME